MKSYKEKFEEAKELTGVAGDTCDVRTIYAKAKKQKKKKKEVPKMNTCGCSNPFCMELFCMGLF